MKISELTQRAKRKWQHIIDKRALKENLNFRDIHHGKKCFIIANGPSINNQDITKLKDEYVIVMNNFYLHKQYDLIHPKFYVILDSRYFNDSEEAIGFFRKFSVHVHEDTVIILPLKAKQMMEKRDLLPKNKKLYVYVRGYVKENQSNVCEIHKTIPTPMSASAMCMIVAIYMGFDPIYLMGMDHDWLKRKSGDKLENFHFYEQKKQDIKDDLTVTYEYNCWCTYQLFKIYRLLRDSTKSRIYNITPDSYLDVFPFKRYEDIIK